MYLNVLPTGTTNINKKLDIFSNKGNLYSERQHLGTNFFIFSYKKNQQWRYIFCTLLYNFR